MRFFDEPPARRNFTLTRKKIEWMDAAGKNVAEYLRDKTRFVKTSYCRVKTCRRKLTWGDGTYNFDHKDNNSSNNSQRNCFLVCRICHGKATKIEKRAERDILGNVAGYKTIKKKVSYKKPKSTTTKKKVTKSTPKKAASRAKKSTSVKRVRAKRSTK